MFTVAAACTTATPRSAPRCKVAVALLALFAAFESTTAVEPMVPESFKVVLCTPAPRAALGKLPVMVIVWGLFAVAKLERAKFWPAASQVVMKALHTGGPESTKPVGNVFATVTLIASF